MNLSNLADVVVDPDLHDTFEEDVVRGLTRPRGKKSIPARHLYDARGSELFARICETEDYYLTRSEASIFARRGADIAEAIGTGAVLVEPGAGDGRKAELLLGMLDSPAVFAPIEISEAPLRAACERIARRFTRLRVRPVCAEFHAGLEMLRDLPSAGRTVFFPGSTIGNLDLPQRRALLSDLAGFVGKGGHVLLGYDVVKAPDVLVRAYDDSEGASAAFALNIVDRINRQLGATLDRDAFRYRARWIEEESRIEMGIVCEHAQRTSVAGTPVFIGDGEFVLTEHSHKFTHEMMEREARFSGLETEQRWLDDHGWFAIALHRAT